jgi:hypothetical protein
VGRLLTNNHLTGPDLLKEDALAIPTAADYLLEARKKQREAMRFACEFWEASDLLRCLSLFADQVSATDIGADSGALEIGISLRRLVTEKCMARWGAKEERRFRKLDDALYRMHVTLHAGSGTFTWEVRAVGLLVKEEIEAARWPDST